jgi:hypothetical protein
MQRLIVLLTMGAAACSASTGSRTSGPAQRAAPAPEVARHGHADVNLTGAWTTGSTGEPAAKEIVLSPQCNYSPGFWDIEQSGDTVRAWKIAESYAKGTANTEPLSRVAEEGWVSGLDLVMGTASTRYLLHYDSTSGHLRGTLNGAPFWAVRVEIARPAGCLPVP